MANRRPCGDLLSDLPVSLIESILVFLPIKDAIRTSILSRKWRFRWTTLPHLAFDVFDMPNANDVDDANDVGFEASFKTFVTRTLLRHQGPLHKLRFNLSSEMIHSCAETDQWLFLLSRKDVKELILYLNQSFDVPSCLYSFHSLTFLEISECVIRPPPPTFKGFPCLKTLILQAPDVSVLTIQSIIEQSPLLETLDYYVGGNIPASDLIIRAPNLKYLDLSFCFCDCKNVYFYAPLLAKLTLFADLIIHEKATYCYYTKFLGSFANLVTLIGDGHFTKYMSFGIEHYQHPLVFHRLKTIKLDDVSFKSTDEILVAVHLIVDASATLCELQLTSDKYSKHDYEEDLSNKTGAHLWDSIYTQNCTFRKLKSVMVENIHGGIQEMNFIKFLLASSPVLEVLKVKPANEDSKWCIMNSMAKLLSYPRASSSASILFEHVCSLHI